MRDVFSLMLAHAFKNALPQRAAPGEQHGIRYLSRRTPLEWNITTLVDVPGVSLRRFPRFPYKYSLYLPRCYNFCLTPERTISCRSKPEKFNDARLSK